MSDDLLECATSAYKDETAPDHSGMAELLVRIERSRRHAPRPLRRVIRTTALALAAALVGAGAWASAAGGIDEVIDRIAAFASLESSTPVAGSTPSSMRGSRGTSLPGRPSKTAAPHPAEAPTSNREIAGRPVESAVPPVPNVEDGPPKVIPRNARSTSRQVPPPPPPPASPTPSSVPAVPADPVGDIDALYRAAHEAHFAQRDYTTAVAAWERYLAAANAGSRMLIEARYNHGMALARTGRTEEAIGALEPFANGEYGQYRQEEARRVIQKLRE